MTSATDAALIASSLEHAGERGGDLTSAVYERLFALHPHLEPMFVMDTDGAVRGEMLSRAFEAVLDFTGERRYAHMLIGAEASNHDGYNVPRETFALFFSVLAEAVQAACGETWTPATNAAWQRLRAELDHYISA